MNLIVESLLSSESAKCALRISILKVKIDLSLMNDCKPGPRGKQISFQRGNTYGKGIYARGSNIVFKSGPFDKEGRQF